MNNQEHQKNTGQDQPSGLETYKDRELSIVRALAAILNESGVHEIDYEVGNCRIRVAKTPKASRSVVISDDSHGKLHAGYESFIEKVGPPAPAPAPAPVANQYWVKSPMVGTVYLSPTPDAAPFVTAGSRVQEGQTILIIEAMKTMNYVKAEKSGCVIEILVKNGAHIEFGQSLVHID